MELKLSDINHFENLDFLAKQVVEGFITGLHKSPYHGFSIEFSEHRLYNAGESTRHIDWKVYAKTDRLYVKRFEEETNLRCQLVIDASNSMYYPEGKELSKIRFSIFGSACLAYLVQKQRDGFGLTYFSDAIEYQSETKSSSGHLSVVLKELNKLAKRDKRQYSQSNITNTLEHLANTLHRRSLVVLFSDMFDSSDNPDALFKSLLHLKHRKHEVVIFHVHDKTTEVDFQFDNKPYTFVDVETGERIKVVPEQLKAHFLKSNLQYMNDVKMKCEQFKITLVDVDINEGWEKIMLAFLVKRAKMR
ncbi:MAG TPA: DUF58 domain-containing protein [Cytophagales bacterium]|nr:DUF58 domain-containing protein [Cytophagales bacterium]